MKNVTSEDTHRDLTVNKQTQHVTLHTHTVHILYMITKCRSILLVIVLIVY